MGGVYQRAKAGERRRMGQPWLGLGGPDREGRKCVNGTCGSSGPASLMHTTAQVSGAFGALGLVLVVFGLMGKKL